MWMQVKNFQRMVWSKTATVCLIAQISLMTWYFFCLILQLKLLPKKAYLQKQKALFFLQTLFQEISQGPSDFLRSISNKDSSSDSGCVSLHQTLSNFSQNQFFFSCSFYASSKVFISFKEPDFIALNRSETITISDFMASCGGLLGLFMGISVLSIVELIYFFTLHLFCTLEHQKSIETSKSRWAMHKRLPTIHRKRF